jgi:CIC family chloride channel protein
VKLLFNGQDLFEKLPLPRWLKPALGMTLLGVLGVYIPHVFGNGFESVNLVLRTQIPAVLLLIVLGAKMLASTLSFGSGAAGGLFTPSLMVGALLGGAYGIGAHHLFPHHTAESGVYALVGMGGVLAGMTHAPLTAIMMIFEQTNSYHLILPIMFVCVISHFTVRLLKGKSMEQEGLARRGITLPQGPEGSVMQTLSVGDVMHEDVHSIPQNAPFPVIVEQFLKEPYNNLYVTGPDDRFLGAIRLHSLKTMLHDAEHLKTVIAADLADENFSVVTPQHRLADTMEIFWQQNTERLPVVNNTHDRKLTGWISKRDLLGVYSQEILRKRQLLVHFSTGAEDEKHDAFVELPENFEIRTIAIPEAFIGTTLSQLAPRSHYGIHVIAVKRRDALTGRDTTDMPDPKMQFRVDDRLVAIGQFDSIAQFMAALATGTAEFKENK